MFGGKLYARDWSGERLETRVLASNLGQIGDLFYSPDSAVLYYSDLTSRTIYRFNLYTNRRY